MDDPKPAGTTAVEDASISVHFVNNVLAAAASYIEDQPDTARDVLAELGAFLTHRLRPNRTVTLAEELEHVRVYLRLEQARFPGRIETELPATVALRAPAAPGDIQAPLGAALGRWLREHPGRVRAALRVREEAGAVELQLDQPDAPDAAGERVRIPLAMEALR